jgi:hypothetical protein
MTCMTKSVLVVLFGTVEWLVVTCPCSPFLSENMEQDEVIEDDIKLGIYQRFCLFVLVYIRWHFMRLRLQEPKFIVSPFCILGTEYIGYVSKSAGHHFS